MSCSLLASDRSIYQRSTALATRDLKIKKHPRDRAGVTGAALVVIERILSPAAVIEAIAAETMAGEENA